MCDIRGPGKVVRHLTEAELGSLSHWWLKMWRTTVSSSLLANCFAEDQLKGREESWCYSLSLSLSFSLLSEKECREMSRRPSSAECRLAAQQWLCQGWARNVERDGSSCGTHIPASHPRKLNSLVKHQILPFTYKAITCCLVALEALIIREHNYRNETVSQYI